MTNRVVIYQTLGIGSLFDAKLHPSFSLKVDCGDMAARLFHMLRLGDFPNNLPCLPMVQYLKLSQF
jgi:hypothetical protein